MSSQNEPSDSERKNLSATDDRRPPGSALRRVSIDAEISTRVRSLADRAFKAASLVWLALVAVVLAAVISRNFSLGGQTLLEELQWHLYAAGFMIGVPYCFLTDEHVRVNLIRQHLRRSGKLWIELLGGLFLLLPFILVVEFYAIKFVLYSWQTHEVSSAPGGLPYRWVIKSFMLIGFGLLLAALLARLWQTACDLLTTKQSLRDRDNRKSSDGN